VNINIKAALLLISGLFLASSALADKPIGRDSSGKDHDGDKTCPFMNLSSCKVELGSETDPIGSYFLVKGLYENNEIGRSFLSRNAERDAATLRCKISGADIKLAEGKVTEASALMKSAIAKILVMRDSGKLDGGAYDLLDASFVASEDCIDPSP